MSNKKGFTIVELVMVVGVVGILVLLGWTYYNRSIASTDDQGSTVTTTASSTMPVVQVNDDLQKAANAVNLIDIDKSIDTSDIVNTLQ